MKRFEFGWNKKSYVQTLRCLPQTCLLFCLYWHTAGVPSFRANFIRFVLPSWCSGKHCVRVFSVHLISASWEISIPLNSFTIYILFSSLEVVDDVPPMVAMMNDVQFKMKRIFISKKFVNGRDFFLLSIEFFYWYFGIFQWYFIIKINLILITSSLHFSLFFHEINFQLHRLNALNFSPLGRSEIWKKTS